MDEHRRVSTADDVEIHFGSRLATTPPIRQRFATLQFTSPGQSRKGWTTAWKNIGFV